MKYVKVLVITVFVVLVCFAPMVVKAQGFPPMEVIQGRIDALEDRVLELEAKLACMTKVGNNVFFNGCNVNIRDGSGDTDGITNGLGNLIIGYNERTGGSITRTGSHNLVVGSEHSFSSFSGFVAGFANTISGESSSVSGGFVNVASGRHSSVSGGFANEASGPRASVSGGIFNVASGERASVSGGNSRTASAANNWAAGSLFENQ